jgi:outer membrane lipoprotein-sorting protein
MPRMRKLQLAMLLFMLFVIYGCQTTSSTSESTPPVSDLKADKAVSDEVKKVEHVVNKISTVKKESVQSKEAAELEKEHIEKSQKHSLEIQEVHSSITHHEVAKAKEEEKKVEPQVQTAEILDATEVVRRSDDLMRGDSRSGTYSMKIVTPKWTRKLTLLVHSMDRDKMFIRILSPAKEAGIGTLRLGNEMWNYLPSVEKTIKIPPSLMLRPWMGSDFANDDLVKESSIVNDYTHQIVDHEDINGETVLKIEFTPKPDAPVIWGKLYHWIRESDFVPLKEEYYSERGKAIKVMEYSDIGSVSDRIIPRTWKMSSLTKEGRSTTIKLLEVTYNEPIDDVIFSMSYLRRVQ